MVASAAAPDSHSAAAFAVRAGARSGGALSPFGNVRYIAGFLQGPGNGPAGIATMMLYEIRGCVEPMPPSGSKPTGGAVDVYGHHEFRLRFALKMAAL
jgi:hypothetical protein